MLDLHKKSRLAYSRLVSAWEGCTACPLHQHRRNVVMVRGEVPSNILYIGEAPGNVEDALGEPFVGPAGKLLDKILAECPKHSYAVGNVLGCVPFKGPPGEPFSSSEEVRPPKPEEALACQGRLSGIVQVCNPKGIVYLGKSATRFAKPLINLPYAEIVHPAALLRAGSGPGHPDFERCILQITAFLETVLTRKSS